MDNKIDALFKNTINRIGRQAWSILQKEHGIQTDNWAKKLSIDLISSILKNSEKFNEAYECLHNQQSKIVFEWYINYKVSYAIIGSKAELIFPYPIDIDELQKKIVEVKLKHFESEYFNFQFKNYKIKSSNETEIFQTWVMEQYLLKNICEPNDGDIIISGGAYHGESSIWFADRIKQNGKIYSFEADKDNFNNFQENIIENNLTDIIIGINKCLWDKNRKVSLNKNNIDNASFCSEEKEGDIIDAITIDYFVEQNNIKNVDFIKLDIEGAEINAIKGAVETINKFKPKICISVYHNVNDIFEIPLLLKSILPDYKLYLSHKSNCWYETVLFATC